MASSLVYLVLYRTWLEGWTQLFNCYCLQVYSCCFFMAVWAPRCQWRSFWSFYCLSWDGHRVSTLWTLQLRVAYIHRWGRSLFFMEIVAKKKCLSLTLVVNDKRLKFCGLEEILLNKLRWKVWWNWNIVKRIYHVLWLQITSLSRKVELICYFFASFVLCKQEWHWKDSPHRCLL